MNKTKIVRSLKDKDHPFTRLSNSIGNLKADEIGIMFHLLSNTDNWILNKTDIMRKSKLGQDRFERAWNHLKELGYVVINRIPMQDGKFGYSYIIFEMPEIQDRVVVSEKPNIEFQGLDNGNTETGSTNNNYIITNDKTIEIGVDPRNGVEGDTDQNEDLILGPEEKVDMEVVPTPSLRCGEGRDIHEDPNINNSKEVFDLEKHLISSEFSNKTTPIEILADLEFEWTEEDINNFTEAIDDLYKEDYPNWKTLLRKKPLYEFIRETKKVHGGYTSIIEMITVIYNKMKNK